MKLSKKDKQELRKSVEVLLNASPDNKKIQLSNETLDQLLFDTYVVNKEKGIKVKLPVWSGDFLKKLDLSRVSFEDVSWSLLGKLYATSRHHYSVIVSSKLYDKIRRDNPIVKKREDREYLVCYSGTNAKINLDKSFEVKYGNTIDICSCDFSNTDLSDETCILKNEVEIHDSNLSNTNIRFLEPNLRIVNTDFTNNNLSELEIDAKELLYYNSWKFTNPYWKFTNPNLMNTNLTNTGAHINLNINDDLDEELKKMLKYYIENYWVGCYLNGKLIQPTDEKKQSAEATRGEYEQYKSQEFANILGSIAEQMDSTGPKK